MRTIYLYPLLFALAIQMVCSFTPLPQPITPISQPLISRPPPVINNPKNDIAFDFSPFLIQYKNGTVDRLIKVDFIPPGTYPETGVKSKDVVIDFNTNLRVRIFMPILPKNRLKLRKLPIVLYSHGGGFVVESAFSSTYHNYVSNITASANVMAVSVDYRLAPEYPLPTAYDDCFQALQWVASQAHKSGDPWLTKYGDFKSLVLAGDSSGGNIVHNVLVRTKTEKLCNGVKVKGLTLLNPYFWGKRPIGNEPTDPTIRNRYRATWEFVTGYRVGLNSPWVDPFVNGARALKSLPCKFVRVTVAEYDIFRDRGVAYYDTLRTNGWNGKAELWDTPGEDHTYFLFDYDSEKAIAEMNDLVNFIKCVVFVFF